MSKSGGGDKAGGGGGGAGSEEAEELEHEKVKMMNLSECLEKIKFFASYVDAPAQTDKSKRVDDKAKIVKQLLDEIEAEASNTERKERVEHQQHQQRRVQLFKTQHRIEQREKAYQDYDNYCQAEAEWAEYLDCNGLPDARDHPQLNSYLHLWSLEDERANMDSLARQCEIACYLIDKLDDLIARSRRKQRRSDFQRLSAGSAKFYENSEQVRYDDDDVETRRIRAANEEHDVQVRQAFRDKLQAWIDRASYDLLSHLDANTERVDLKNARYHKRLAALVLCFWIFVKFPISMRYDKDRLVEILRQRVLPADGAARRAAGEPRGAPRGEALADPAHDKSAPGQPRQSRARQEKGQGWTAADQPSANGSADDDSERRDYGAAAREEAPTTAAATAETIGQSRGDRRPDGRARRNSSTWSSGGRTKRHPRRRITSARRKSSKPRLKPSRLPWSYSCSSLSSTHTATLVSFDTRHIGSRVFFFFTTRLPDSVLWFEPPLVAHWLEDERVWSTEDVHDIKYNEEKQQIQFRTGRLGLHGLAACRYVNLPFQSWELKPASHSGAVALNITGAIIQLELLVKVRALL
ncbi:unnamed protein product [Trichogramma brassicae]|uniref:Uncharacterized protein n=1 Tax=Trichogramma brassicae TaxID=86971 RepID=A0A6H5HX09_9HYME|nr:unnamed protein product [Trichogramma brassicae]